MISILMPSVFLSGHEYTIARLTGFVNSSFRHLLTPIHRLSQLKIFFVLCFIFKGFQFGIIFTFVDIYFRFCISLGMVLWLAKPKINVINCKNYSQKGKL